MIFRLSAAQYKLAYGEEMPVEQLVQDLCNQKQRYTQVGGMYSNIRKSSDYLDLKLFFVTIILINVYQASVRSVCLFCMRDGIDTTVISYINRILLAITRDGRRPASETTIPYEYYACYPFI